MSPLPITLEADATLLYFTTPLTRGLLREIPFPLDPPRPVFGRTVSGLLLIDPVGETKERGRLVFSLKTPVTIAKHKGFLPGLVGTDSLELYRLVKQIPGMTSTMMPIHAGRSRWSIKEPKDLALKTKVVPVPFGAKAGHTFRLYTVRGKTIFTTGISLSGKVEPVLFWGRCGKRWGDFGQPLYGRRTRAATVTISEPREYVWGV